MIILHDKDTLLHETVELLGSKLRPALESPERIKAVIEAIQSSQKHDLRTITASQDEQETALELAKATHDSDYLKHIQHVFKQWLDKGLVEENDSVLPECFRLRDKAHEKPKIPKDIYARAGYYAFDMSTGIIKSSWSAIIASANLAIQAAHLLLPQTTETPKPKSVLALCRPPGHHCTPSQAGGYCYINNITVAITTLRHFNRAKRTRRVSDPHAHLPSTKTSTLRFAILDLDFHHGNGTQEIFWDDQNVLYVSIHGEDEFPYYTGGADETGPKNHAASNTNINYPLAAGSTFDQYIEKLNAGLEAIGQYHPDYLLVSLGFDTFQSDPLGSFKIQTEDYKKMAHTVRNKIRGLPALIVLEGGYVVERLGENLLSFLAGWEDAEGKL